jgi:site-specific recombinase XerD
MKIKAAGKPWLDYLRLNSQKNTVTSYEAILARFRQDFGERSIEGVTTDEIIFTTVKPRNRLMLEMMARKGMRVGEVLKLTNIHLFTGLTYTSPWSNMAFTTLRNPAIFAPTT